MGASPAASVQGRFTAALNAAPIFVYTLDAEGRILTAAGKGLERLGLRPEDVVGVSVTEAFGDDPEVLGELREVLAGRRRSSAHVAALGLELESWLEPLFDERGRLLEVSGVSIDVAELRAAQQQVAERQRFLANIIDHLPVAVSVRDGEGRYVVVNRMIAESAGRSVEDMLGRNLVETWGEAVAPVVELDRQIVEGKVRESSDLMRNYGGEDRHVSVRRSAISLPNGETGVLTVAEDITERVKGLAALEVSEAKNSFFAKVSHELRTPLNSVLGFVELLSGSEAADLTPRQLRYLENIRSGGAHLLAVINDLLDLSQIEVGHLELRSEPLDPADAAAQVVERMQPVAAARGVRLAVQRSRSAGTAMADRRRLDQVLYNLVSNAIKFTPSGGSVVVRVHPLSSEVAIAVRDTGVGIPAADRERIFEEFSQLDNEPVRGQPGSGLGLTVARRLVERMGGTISVRSAPGRGSTFTVRLPAGPSSGPRLRR